jgi:hypothetical protein
VYADVAASTGWTWEYIGQCMTLPRLAAMNAHWRKYPPVHVSVALFVGAGERTTKPAPVAANEADMETAAYLQSLPVQKIRLPS